MVLLEAMYFGTPVISSVNGGSCTLIQNGYNGFVMENFDSEEWVKCIDSALADDELVSKMKNNAQKTIEENYTWDMLADTFMSAYEKAIILAS